MAENNSMEEKSSETRSGVSRRNVFHILGSVPIAAASAGAVLGQNAAPAPHATHTPPIPVKDSNRRKTFNDHQWKTVAVLSDLVIPADDRSGSATQAGVPEFIDDWLAFRTEEGSDRLQAEILGGLMWLDRESQRLFSRDFADASGDQQKQILDRIAWPGRAAVEDQPWVAFFSEFRDLTVSGFFSSKVGVRDLPYLGNTAVAEWKGCDPKVWSTIEDRVKNGYEGLVKVTKTSQTSLERP